MCMPGRRKPAALVAAALCLSCAPGTAAECPWDCDGSNDNTCIPHSSRGGLASFSRVVAAVITCRALTDRTFDSA